MFTIMRHVQDNTPPIPHIIQKTWRWSCPKSAPENLQT
jgi:hypothetical protein